LQPEFGSNNAAPDSMKIFFVETGKTTDRYVNDGAGIYSARIKKYTAFETVTLPGLKSTKGLSPEEVRKREGLQQLNAVGTDSFVILLDERGDEYTTLEFADFLRRMVSNMRKNIFFVSGGAWGFSSEVYERADMKMSLSKLTFPHQLVRLLFLEQLYRVLTVLKGNPYHHE
jgi:23S rRNA (pseudouridine1915-N3)-methyltransferase